MAKYGFPYLGSLNETCNIDTMWIYVLVNTGLVQCKISFCEIKLQKTESYIRSVSNINQ